MLSDVLRIRSKFEMFENPEHLNIYRHGQFEGSSTFGSFGDANTSTGSDKASKSSALALRTNSDDFHSPCRPSDYVQQRIKPQLRFYQARLPGYDRTKTLCQTILVLGTFTGVALALFRVTTWAAIASGVVGAVTAWMEFHGTEDKLTRYSDAITQIDSVSLSLSID